ncbi:MAG: hypothetical protein HC921_20705 [Synechococcaceae cyanobacterium SM2_3_1]|nr:hypothetical protein [Synechococcaceae cyanobacterium SM2_3_1]
MSQKIKLEINPRISIGDIDLNQSREMLVNRLFDKLNFSAAIRDKDGFLRNKGIEVWESGKSITFYRASSYFVDLKLFGRSLIGASYLEILDWIETISDPIICDLFGFRVYGIQCIKKYDAQTIHEVFVTSHIENSINLQLIPYRGLGSICFDINREAVRNAIFSLFVDPVFHKYSIDNHGRDWFEKIGINIEYNSNDLCEAIIVCNQSDYADPWIDVSYQGSNIMGRSFQKLISWLEQVDRDLYITDQGITSLKLGVNIADANGIEMRLTHQGVIVFSKGYDKRSIL